MAVGDGSWETRRPEWADAVRTLLSGIWVLSFCPKTQTTWVVHPQRHECVSVAFKHNHFIIFRLNPHINFSRLSSMRGHWQILQNKSCCFTPIPAHISFYHCYHLLPLWSKLEYLELFMWHHHQARTSICPSLWFIYSRLVFFSSFREHLRGQWWTWWWRWKVRGSSKLLQFILRGTWTSEPHFEPIVVERFQSGPKWRKDQPTSVHKRTSDSMQYISSEFELGIYLGLFACVLVHLLPGADAPGRCGNVSSGRVSHVSEAPGTLRSTHYESTCPRHTQSTCGDRKQETRWEIPGGKRKQETRWETGEERGRKRRKEKTGDETREETRNKMGNRRQGRKKEEERGNGWGKRLRKSKWNRRENERERKQERIKERRRGKRWGRRGSVAFLTALLKWCDEKLQFIPERVWSNIISGTELDIWL